MPQRLLGGWLRLWIILCVWVYGGVVATVTFMGMPSNAPIPTTEEFLHSISDESLQVLHRAASKAPQESGTKGGRYEILPPKQPWELDPIVRRTPNTDGFEIILPADVTNAEEDRIRSEVLNMMATRLTESRWLKIRAAVLWWLVPCLLALCAGLATRWVYRGFRGDQT